MDEQTQKLLESLSRLSSASDDYYEKIRAQTDNYNTLLVAGMKQEAAVARNAVVITKTNEAYDQQMKALGLTKNALGEYERITAKLTAEQQKRIAEETAIKEKQNARDKVTATYHQMMADKTSTVIKGLQKFGEGLNKTIFDSTKGQAKYGSVLSSAGDAVQNFGALFGPLGKAVTSVISAFMKLGGAALEQQEHLNTAYEKMAEFGAIDVTGVSGMFKNLQNAGFTVKELDKFGGILKTAGPNLAMMGTTAADGAKKFADTMGAIKNTGVEKELRMLGFTSETMAKTFADYQGLMARQGFLQGKTTAQIATESAKYAKTLDELSKLTGESRDEMQKRMDADANDMKFRLKIQEMEAAGDKEGADRLRKASVLIADFGEDTASGFREMIANNGRVVGDASAKLMLSTGNAAKQITEDLNAGKISHLEAARLMAEAKSDQINRFRELGKLDSEIMKELGLSVKDMDAANKYRGKTQKDLEDIEKKQELQAKGALDKQRAAEVARVMTERNLEQSKDRLINIVGTKLVGAFEKLMQMVNTVAKQLAHFAKWLGGPDFTDLFDTPDDIKKQLEDAQKELAHAEKSAVAGPSLQGLSGEEAMQAQAEYDDQQRKLQDKRDKVKQLQERYKAKVTETGEEAESPEQKKLKQEAEKLAKERLALEEQIEDKSKLIYNQVLAQFEGGEEALKDAKKREEFDKKLIEAKAKYVTRQEEVDKRLIKIGEESQALKKKELDKTLPSSPSPVNSASTGKGVAPSSGAVASAPAAKTSSPTTKTTGGVSSGEDNAVKTKLDDLLVFGSKSGSKENFDALSDDFKQRILNAATEYNSATSKKIKINSAKRDSEDQQRVWDESVEAGRPGRGPTGMPIAKPGSSKHEKGQAVDIQNYNDNDAVTAMNKQGLFQTVPKDPVHFELPKAEFGGIFSGPKSGYPVLMHGKEAVIPMPKLGDLNNPNAVSKTELDQVPNAVSGSNNSAMDQFISIQTDLMNMLASKLDAVEARLAKSNDIQENILTYSAA